MRAVICLIVAVAVVLARPVAQGPQTTPFEFEEITIAQLEALMRLGRYTSRQIVERYLQRIEEIDRKGPELKSVIEVNPDALAIAEALDAERKAKGARGLLHGLPILIKDNIDTADKMRTTAGSLALENAIAPRDAFIVERLRAAGAVIIGKTNLSEWANFRSTKSTSGWSARGGQVKNPYVLDRNPCGSSSGSGTAVAANLASIAIGTETDGSIVCPSAATGLVGIKPTVGLVSRSGVIPISRTQDTPGPMARTVTDAAILLSAITGQDPRDPATLASETHAIADYTRSLHPDALQGARIGVARKRYTGYSPNADRLFEAAVAVMKARGAVIVDPADIPTAAQLDECEFEVLLYEFKSDLNAYLKSAGAGASVRSLDELIAFNEKHKDREMPFFGQEILLMAAKKGALTSPEYRKALSTCQVRARAGGIDAVIAKHKLDAIVAPTGSPAWLTDLVNGDHFLGASSTPAAVAGYPTVTVPAGSVFGLPVGISFIGTAWSEEKLIRLAYAYEQATRHRKPPRMMETVDLGGRPRD